MIADWYQYAILELTFIPGFQISPKWIGVKLGISATKATLAIDRLKRLGFIEVMNMKLVKNHSPQVIGCKDFKVLASYEKWLAEAEDAR